MACRLSCLLLLSLFCTLCSGFHDATFTFSLPARHMECFYEHFEVGSQVEMQYQVLKGGELDVNFMVANPQGVYIVIDRKSDGWWPLEIEETGEYGICLDNSFSKLFSKLVFLSVGRFVGKPIYSNECPPTLAFLKTAPGIAGKTQGLCPPCKVRSYVSTVFDHCRILEASNRH